MTLTERGPLHRGRNLFLAAACLVVLVGPPGCGGRHTVTEDREGGYQSSRSMPLSKARGTLQAAQQARMEGRFKQAADGFQAVYANAKAGDDLRSQALFGLAEVSAALTNPGKNLDRAIDLFQKVVVEFPASALRERAERRILEIRTQIGSRRSDGS